MYNVVWQTKKGNELVECVSLSHAKEVFLSVASKKKKITKHENGCILRVA